MYFFSFRTKQAVNNQAYCFYLNTFLFMIDSLQKRKVKEVSESQELRVTLPTQSIADALFRSVADKEEKQEEIQQCFSYCIPITYKFELPPLPGTNIKFFNGMPDSPYNSITGRYFGKRMNKVWFFSVSRTRRSWLESRRSWDPCSYWS